MLPVVAGIGISWALGGRVAAQAVDARWLLPATGAWEVGGNWSTAPLFPGASPDDKASIDASGAAYTVTMSASNRLGALHLDSPDAALRVAGSLEVAQINVDAGTFVLDGGRLTNGSSAVAITLGPAGRFESGTAGGSLLKARLVGGEVRFGRGDVHIGGQVAGGAGGIELQGAVLRVGEAGAGRVICDGGDIGGTGEVVVATFLGNTSTAGFTIGSGITVRMDAGASLAAGFGFRNDGAIVSSGRNGFTVEGVLNYGSITAAGGPVLLNGSANYGDLNVSDAVLTVRTTALDASRSIVLNNVAATIGGDLALSTLRKMTRAGGTLAADKLDLEGGAFDTSAYPGVTARDRLLNGTYSSPDSRSPLPPALENVQLASDVDLDVGAAGFSLLGSTTVNANVTLRAGSASGSVLLGTGAYGNLGVGGTGRVLFKGGPVQLAVGWRAQIEAGVTLDAGDADVKVVSGYSGWQAAGFTSRGTIIVGPGKTFDIECGEWTNAGVIRVDGGTLYLGGTSSLSSLGSILRDAASRVVFGSTLNAPGAVIDMTRAAGGPLDLGAAKLTGVKLASAGRTINVVAPPGYSRVWGTWTDVTFAGDVDVQDGGTIEIRDRLALDGSTLRLRGPDTTLTGEAWRLDGTGQLVFDNAAQPVRVTFKFPLDGLTVGPGATVRTGAGGAYARVALNDGTISAQTPGRAIVVYGGMTNRGVLRAIDGGTLELQAPFLNRGTVRAATGGLVIMPGGTSQGTIECSGATLRLTGAIPRPLLDTLDLTDANLEIAGTLDNTGSELPVNDGRRTIRLAGGTVSGGLITAATPADVLSVTYGGLQQVTVRAAIDVRGNGGGLGLALTDVDQQGPITAGPYGQITVSGGWTCGASVTLQGSSRITLQGTYDGIDNLRLVDSAATLKGQYTTAQLARLSGTNSIVEIRGLLDNTGSTLDVNTPGLLIGLADGTLLGGTARSGAGTPAALVGTLDGVTLAASGRNLYPGTTNTTGVIVVRNSLALAGGSLQILAGTSTRPGGIVFSGTQTLSGTGELVLEGGSFPPIMYACRVTGGVLTIEPGITLRSGTRSGYVSLSSTGLVNRGVISAGALQNPFTLEGALTNQGTFQATNGGRLAIAAAAKFSNWSGDVLTGGTYAVYEGSGLDFGAARRVVTNLATVLLSGTASTFAALAPLAANGGSLTLADGRAFATAALANDGTITVERGARLDVAGVLSGAGSATVATGARLTAAGLRQGSLTLGDGATAALTPGAPGGRLGALALAGDHAGWRARFDLADSALVLAYEADSPLQTVRSQVIQAYGATAAAHWAGPGITSSAAAAAADRFGVGYAEAADVLGLSGDQAGTWQGQDVDATTLLVRFTLRGDADLDGAVGFADLLRVAQNYDAAAADWAHGDFDYDGAVGFSDLLAVAQRYDGAVGLPGPVPGAADGFAEDWARAAASVPEPAPVVAGAGALVAAGLRRPRRRARSAFLASSP